MKFKFLTLNIWNGGRLMPAVLDLLRDEQPDIFFLQEVNSRTEPELEDRFRSLAIIHQHFPNYDYYFGKVFGDLRPKEGLVVEGNAIFSRWPLKNCTNTFIDLPYAEVEHWKWTDFSQLPEAIASAEVTLGDQQLLLLNVHGPWELSEQDSIRRLHMRDRILELIAGHTLVLAAGDFNVVPTTRTIKDVETKLTNVFQPELMTSFNLKHKTNPGYATAVVDMVLSSPKLKVIEKKVPQQDVSDHLPLVVEFELSE